MILLVFLNQIIYRNNNNNFNCDDDDDDILNNNNDINYIEINSNNTKELLKYKDKEIKKYIKLFKIQNMNY